MRKRRFFIALLIITLVAVGSWQYALTKDYPLGNGEIVPSPDGELYAALVYLKKRPLFSEVEEFMTLELGRGTYDQSPEIIHYDERALAAIDLDNLNRMPRDQLISWTTNSSEVSFHLGKETIHVKVP